MFAQPGAEQGTQEVLHTLQEQATAIQYQLDQMSLSRKDLVQRMSTATNPEVVARLQAVLAQHDATAAELHARLLDLNAKVAELQQGTPQVIIPPFTPAREWPIDPDAMTGVFVFFSIALIVPMSVALLRRAWRRPLPPPAPATENVSSARLDRLEQAVDAIAIEVERIAESQRFVAKLLAERPAARRAAPEANDGASLEDGAPFLALGAGPMEPIRVPERQAVKPSITPH